MGETAGQFALELAVGGGLIGVLTETVTQRQMTGKLRAVLGADVQVVARQGSAGRVVTAPEGLAARDATVTLMLISLSRQSSNNLRQPPPHIDYNVYVNDGLGRQTGNRRAADVLDGHGQRTERHREPVTKDREIAWPMGVIVIDFDFGAFGHGIEDCSSKRILS